MSNLLSSLRAGSQALHAFEQAVSITQNNVMNASTPGYARQSAKMTALSFAPEAGLAGGTAMAGMVSSRSSYAERIVHARLSEKGAAAQASFSLQSLEARFSLNDSTGVAAALDRFYSAASAWSVTPNSMSARQNVLTGMNDVAEGFHRAADALAAATAETDDQLTHVVDQINQIASAIQKYNADKLRGAPNDAAVDATLHENLDRLAELVDVQARQESDGTVTLLAGGRVPLVSGATAYPLTLQYETPADAVYLGTPPQANVVGSRGEDVNSSIQGGKLASLLSFRNETLPGLRGGPYAVGELNSLAKQVADRVSEIVSTGWPPASDPFFIYGASPTSIAHTISVNPTMASVMLDAAQPGPTNQVPLQLAQLGKPVDNADKIDGQSYTAFYGRMLSQIGQDAKVAKETEDVKSQLAVQAHSFRSDIAGVSLDEEAVQLVQFQRAYQATARMISVVDEMTEIVVNIGRR
jgi:flagellar hook-associated protein 1 FlgK